MLSRYRNASILLLVILGQLVLLAYQVKTNQDVRMIRVWAVTAVTPAARTIEEARSGVAGFLQNYVLLHDAQEKNKQLQQEISRLKMENHYLKTELSTAERARALIAFQQRTPSKTIAARIIATGTGTNSKVVFVDRGSVAGVQKGMAVITADGIVGKVLGSYPTASEVQLITDTGFAAGVISQKNRVRGTLKGQGYDTCKVDYVPNEDKVEVGEWFYTSGDDRIFPMGLPVGVVKVARNGSPFKEILIEPSGIQGGLEEVLIILEGVHQPIPQAQTAAGGPIYLTPPPEPETRPSVPSTNSGTEADRLREKYKEIGEAQGHKFGEGLPGSKPPDFNLKPDGAARPKRPSAANRETDPGALLPYPPQ